MAFHLVKHRDIFTFNLGYSWSWSAYSPDLDPCIFFLWSFLKDIVYRNNLHRIQEILPTVSSLNENILAGVVQLVLDASGAHIENLFN
jgi:hypothetical protein